MDIKITSAGNLVVNCDGRKFNVFKIRCYWVIKENGKLLSDRHTSMDSALEYIDTVCSVKAG